MGNFSPTFENGILASSGGRLRLNQYELKGLIEFVKENKDEYIQYILGPNVPAWVFEFFPSNLLVYSEGFFHKEAVASYWLDEEGAMDLNPTLFGDPEDNFIADNAKVTLPFQFK